MESPFDTPPDGDFARYVEQLTARSPTVAGVKQTAADPEPKSERRPASPGKPAGLSWWTVGKWVLIPWLALEVVAGFGLQAALFIVPVLIVAVWLIGRFKNFPDFLPAGRLRELAEQLAMSRDRHEFRQRK